MMPTGATLVSALAMLFLSIKLSRAGGARVGKLFDIGGETKGSDDLIGFGKQSLEFGPR